MKNLKKRFDQPGGFVFDRFKNDRGQVIRYGHIQSKKSNTHGALVLGLGYSEPIEKYFEVINDLTQQGYDVWVMDWASQGGSERIDPKDPQRSYDEKNFLDHHRDDLYKFVTQIIKVPQTDKIGFLGFSMGGHIGLKLLERYPHTFDTAAMTSAMIEFETGDIPKHMAPILARTMAAAGKKADYVPGGGPWSSLKHAFNENDKTHDSKRFQIQLEIMKKNPSLQVGSPRVQWILHAYPSIKKVQNKKNSAKIQTPILFSIAMKDTVVNPAAQLKLAQIIPNAHAIKYQDAKHELWIEKDSIRDHWLKNMIGFLNTTMQSKKIEPVRISQKTPALKPPKTHPPKS